MQSQLAQLEKELDSEALRTQLIVSLDSASRIKEGEEAELYVDAEKMHLFDPGAGENLTGEDRRPPQPLEARRSQTGRRLPLHGVGHRHRELNVGSAATHGAHDPWGLRIAINPGHVVTTVTSCGCDLNSRRPIHQARSVSLPPRSGFACPLGTSHPATKPPGLSAAHSGGWFYAVGTLPTAGVTGAVALVGAAGVVTVVGMSSLDADAEPHGDSRHGQRLGSNHEALRAVERDTQRRTGQPLSGSPRHPAVQRATKTEALPISHQAVGG